MTPIERGRFCSSCQKQVIDFSNKSDREIAMFFKRPSTGSVCGRFMEDQLNREIDIPKKRIPWLRYFFQFALPTFLASCDSRLQGKVNAHQLPVTPLLAKEEISKQVCTTTVGVISSDVTFNADTFPSSTVRECKRTMTDTVIEQIDKIIDSEPPLIIGDVESILPPEYVPADSSESIKGKVVDEGGKPVPAAAIMIKGTKNGTTTDDNGLFSIYPKSEGDDMTLIIAAVGFNISEMRIKHEGNNCLGDIVLVPIKPQLGEVIVAGVTVARTEKKKTITLLQPIFKDAAFKNFRTYPNPIRSNSPLTIEWKQNQFGDLLLQLFNQSGQLVFSKEISMTEGSTLFTINMPDIIAGNYFLKLTTASTGRSYTEKLVVT